MKIICTKEEFAAMLEVCIHCSDDGECNSCLLYVSCGGEKKVVQFCTIDDGCGKRRNDLMTKKRERPRLTFDDKE